ncbi:MAG: DUF3108 domain-containing protein [Flavobacteriaceae bacterium]|nr:DUF3108 domain-containing protein [Bacteroidia bacterium]MBT8287096.1 DUF3108 domain-containing protein [Bacteroidia bacterium]NNF74297.1 DUF3108 domain-containing protein [Flavobacteriaceae bacterium]NNK73232.1 DUF3108 domain-containing protein [Flavobacteriaceae bacterium]
MNKTLLIVIGLLLSQISFAQADKAFDTGEWFKFRMSYSGWMKAGNATLEVKNDQIDGKPVHHVVGNGWTTGAIKWFFKVEDRYESYFDKETGLPYRFIRNIDEGGHTKNIQIDFDQKNKKAHINNIKHNKKSVEDTQPNVHDMVSAYYFLRNTYDTETIRVGDEISLNMFFDSENYNFRLKFLGSEMIRTKFGKIKTLKFRPYVMAGRVFKEQESLTLWVSADKNKIPLRIKADLAVGSLRADLEAFKGLKHQFEIQF